MLKVEAISTDLLLKECEAIQSFLEADYPVDNPAACEAKGENKEEYICKFFGCGRKLTIQEKLFGDKCFKHSLTKKQKYERT